MKVRAKEKKPSKLSISGYIYLQQRISIKYVSEKCITRLHAIKEDITINLFFSSLNSWNEALPAAKIFSTDMSWGFCYSQSSFQCKELSWRSEKVLF